MGFASRKGAFREGSLDQYLKEISRYPLIDKAEEARLAKGIKRGEEEALDKLVRSNLRFVVSVAKKYQNQGVPLADLRAANPLVRPRRLRIGALITVPVSPSARRGSAPAS